MKLLKTLCAFAALVALTLSAGCIKEDMSDCPPEVNTELTFSYTGDENDAAMFSKMIDRVTVFVFNSSDGLHILTKTVDRAALRERQGTDLYLPAGDYRIVSWANAFDNTEILFSSLSAGRVHAPAYGTTPQGTITTNDHLYYGVIDLTVPAAATLPGNTGVYLVTGDIPHRGAHINMEVHTKGFGSPDDRASYPRIEMTNLMPQYNMQMGDASPATTTYFPAVAWDADKKTMAARFQTLRFAALNDIELLVRNAQSNEVKATLSLADFIAANAIDMSRHEITISVLFEFSDLGVDISIPDWSGGNVDPDI